MVDVGGVPTVMTGNNDGGFGGAWVAVILVALLAGRGGFGGCGDGGYGGNAELNGRFNSIENQIDNLGNREDLARTLMSVCETQRDIIETKYDLGQQISQNRFDDAIGFKDVELQIAQCCCNTQANISAAKQEILDKLNANEVKALENKIFELQNQIAKPAYITYAPGTAYFPPTPAVGVGGCGYGYGYGVI